MNNRIDQKPGKNYATRLEASEVAHELESGGLDGWTYTAVRAGREYDAAGGFNIIIRDKQGDFVGYWSEQ